MIKDPPASAGDIRDIGLTPGLGRSPVGGHENPWTEEPGGLQCIESQRVEHN